MDTILGILAIISAILLIIKAIRKNYIAVIGEAIPRLLLGIVLLSMVISPYIFYKYKIDYLLFIVILVSDIIIYGVKLITEKYESKIDSNVVSNIIEELQHKHYAIMDNSQIGFYVFNSDYILEYANFKLAEVLGYGSIGEIIGKNLLDIVHPDYREVFKEKSRQRFSGEIPKCCYTLDAIKKSGEVIKLRVAGTCTTNGHPTITGTVTLV